MSERTSKASKGWYAQTVGWSSTDPSDIGRNSTGHPIINWRSIDDLIFELSVMKASWPPFPGKHCPASWTYFHLHRHFHPFYLDPSWLLRIGVSYLRYWGLACPIFVILNDRRSLSSLWWWAETYRSACGSNRLIEVAARSRLYLLSEALKILNCENWRIKFEIASACFLRSTFKPICSP